MRAATPSAAAEIASPDHTELQDTFSRFFQRFVHCTHVTLQKYTAQLNHLQKRLQHPREKIQQQMQRLDQFENQLLRAMHVLLNQKQQKISYCAKVLDTLSPLKILQRGFSVTRNKKNGKLIRRYQEVAAGDYIVTQVSDGEIVSIVGNF